MQLEPMGGQRGPSGAPSGYVAIKWSSPLAVGGPGGKQIAAKATAKARSSALKVDWSVAGESLWSTVREGASTGASARPNGPQDSTVADPLRGSAGASTAVASGAMRCPRESY